MFTVISRDKDDQPITTTDHVTYESALVEAFDVTDDPPAVAAEITTSAGYLLDVVKAA